MPGPPPPSYPSDLARYRLLAPTAGVRVSPLCLGTLNFGQAWAHNMGSSALGKDAAFAILDAYFQNGGNFIDTANGYQAGTSENILGEWLSARGNRDQIVLSSKFSMGFKFDRAQYPVRVNYAGNSTKSLRLSVQSSLEKLQTSYLDILFVHYHDYTTSIPELMSALNDEVRSGRVNYIAASDMPAWLVVKANDHARQHGMAQFVAYQGEWSLLRRDVEREIIPMCQAEGMAFMPYGVLGQGKFKSTKELSERQASGQTLRSFWGPGHQTESEALISQALEKVAGKTGRDSLTQVALAYHLQRYPYVFPVFGCRTTQQLEQNIQALSISLSDDDVYELENVVPFELGFPYDQYGQDPHRNNQVSAWLLKMTGHHYEFVQHQRAISLGPLGSQPKQGANGAALSDLAKKSAA